MNRRKRLQDDESKRSTRSQRNIKRLVVSESSDSDGDDDDTSTSLKAMNLDEDEDEPTASTSRSARERNSHSNEVATNSSGSGDRNKIRKQFSTLIEKCQEFEEKEGFDRTTEELMSKNIGKGQKLFNEIGGGPGDMFLAFMHTRICSSMLRFKTANIGSNTSAFKVDVFLNAIFEKCVAPDSAFDAPEAGKCISSNATECCRTLTRLSIINGALEHKPPPENAGSKEKEKKQRTIARRRQFDESTMSQATHRELMTKANANQRPPSQKSHESFSKEILAVLKTNCRNTEGRSMNMFEFVLDKNSFAATIESLFYVAFLVRDGDVAFFRQDGQSNHDYVISIKPATPPKDSEQEKPGRKKKKKKKRPATSERSQFILSFSMKRWQELCAISSGDSVISQHKRNFNEEEVEEEMEVDPEESDE